MQEEMLLGNAPTHVKITMTNMQADVADFVRKPKNYSTDFLVFVGGEMVLVMAKTARLMSQMRVRLALLKLQTAHASQPHIQEMGINSEIADFLDKNHRAEFVVNGWSFTKNIHPVVPAA